MKTEYDSGAFFEIEKAAFGQGRITSIIGRNGCGKTTLLRTIAGRMPYSGSIRIQGRECREYRPRERAKKLSYLPQIVKPVSMDVRTLAEHGRFPWHGNFRILSREDRRLVDEALELTQMKAHEDRDLSELSGGELRRAYLAMAIAQNAEMMLLDEPTTYMDIESQDLFYDIVRKLAEKGTGIVMTCHSIEQSFSYSDEIVVMDDRTVKRSGSPEAVSEDAELLRSIFGAAVKKADDEGLLYPYVLVK